MPSNVGLLRAKLDGFWNTPWTFALHVLIIRTPQSVLSVKKFILSSLNCNREERWERERERGKHLLYIHSVFSSWLQAFGVSKDRGGDADGCGSLIYFPLYSYSWHFETGKTQVSISADYIIIGGRTQTYRAKKSSGRALHGEGESNAWSSDLKNRSKCKVHI